MSALQKSAGLVSGYSNKGILNIIDWFKPNIFIGGLHLKKLNPKTDDENALIQIEQILLRSCSTKYFTCHCTGTEQYRFLKEIMGNRFEYISAELSC